jgi:hypothetical protein
MARRRRAQQDDRETCMTQTHLLSLLRRLVRTRPAQPTSPPPSVPKGQKQWDRQAKGIARQLDATGQVLDNRRTAGDAAARALDEDLDLQWHEQRVTEELERLRRERQNRP